MPTATRNRNALHLSAQAAVSGAANVASPITRALAGLEQVGNRDPRVAQWIYTELMRHCAPSAIIQALVASGRTPETASLLVGLAQRGFSIVPGAAAPATPAAHAASSPSAAAREDFDSSHADQHVVAAGVRVLASMGIGGVDIKLFDGLISPTEVEHIKRLAAANMRPSTVIDDGQGSRTDDRRTSDCAFLPRASDSLLHALETRISQAVGVPLERAEGLQVLHYQHAGRYLPHFDYFGANTNPAARLAESGERVGTVILYLNDCERGGATYFPQLDLAIHPHAGMAFWFGYLRDGQLNARSKHGGMPVIEGEKWIATEWYRERTFAPLLATANPTAEASTGART